MSARVSSKSLNGAGASVSETKNEVSHLEAKQSSKRQYNDRSGDHSHRPGTHLAYLWHVYHSYSKPTELQQLLCAMLAYNVYQSLLNGATSVWLVYHAYKAGFSVWGNYEDLSTSGFPLAFGVWSHYNNKYLELFDTLFMVSKKKREQISFLHVYHHILLVWAWYVCISFAVGGDTYFGSAFNSLVHFFMYGYYGMALLSIPCPWKKQLTMFQMIQFVACASQSIYCFIKGNVWWFVPALQLFVMVQMLVLFSRFYAKKYTPQSKKGAKGSGGANSNKKTDDETTDASDSITSICPPALTHPGSPTPTFSTALVDEVGDAAVASVGGSSGVNKRSAATAAESDAAAEEEHEPVKRKSSSSKKKSSGSSSSKKKRSQKAE